MSATVVIADGEGRLLRWGGAALLGAGALLARQGSWPGLPCPLRTLTGVPCPLCGTQTSVKAVLRFDLGSAVAANPMGLLLVVAAVCLVVAGPALIRAARRVPVTVVMSLWGACMAALWAFELHRFGFV